MDARMEFVTLVKEGEGLTQKLKLGRLSKPEADQITRRLDDISKLLDANLVKRNGLTDQSMKSIFVPVWWRLIAKCIIS